MLDLRVRNVRFSSGERFAVLTDSMGAPLFDPCVYAVSELRARNLAANTIANALRALKLLYEFLESSAIDLNARIRRGELLTLGELEELARTCRMRMGDREGVRSTVDRIPTLTSHSQRLLENFRSSTVATLPAQVAPDVAAARLLSIRDYLVWLISVNAGRSFVSKDVRQALTSESTNFVSWINARLPTHNSGTKGGSREGLEKNVILELLRVTDPSCAENPWLDSHSRHRNALIVALLFHLGIRRGELLGLRVSDFDFRKGTLLIARRPDDPIDPRKYQPTVKTRAREIPVSDALLDMTQEYILDQRRAIPGARKHDFLLVATDSGSPLSTPALNRVFEVMRTKCTGLPQNLSPHLLRHTWNDRFSEEMDRNNVASEIEKKTRSYLMGWSEHSDTAVTYTRRHVRAKAQEASLNLQRQALRRRDNEN